MIGHSTYLDLTPDQRQKGAKAARDRLRSLLTNPLTSPAQMAAVQAQLDRIAQWEKGTLTIEKSTSG